MATGHGSLELIHRLARLLLAPGEAAAVLGPTFGEYRAASLARGARVAELRAREADGFRWDVESVAGRLAALSPAVVWVCVPNNPTGVQPGRESVRAWMAAAPRAWFILDEAYADFAEAPWDAAPLLATGRAVVLRSLTKIGALPGFRAGYAVGPEALIGLLRHDGTAPLGGLESGAAVAVLGDRGHAARARAAAREGVARLRDGLAALGVRTHPTCANYVLADVARARWFRWRMAREGVLVEDGTGFGLPHLVRIGAPAPSEVRRVVEAAARASLVPAAA